MPFSQVHIFLFLVLICFGVLCLLFFAYKTSKRESLLTKFTLNQNVHESSQNKPTLEKLGHQVSSLISTNQEEVSSKFYAAGFYNFKLASLYMPFKYSLLLFGAGFIYWYGRQQQLELSTLVAIGATWLVLCIIVPDAILDSRSKALRNKISNQLPYLLDLMAVCVQTGMTIESAMSYLAKEMKGFDKDISHFLNKTNDRSRIVGLDKALDELYAELPSNEMRSFVMTLKQSLQYGTSVYQVLTTLSADIREVQMLGIEEKIGKLAAKMSIPLIVFIMLPIVILIAAPGVMRMMSGV
ncbi:type II secretion system F family protein [Vibrio clamense]|uniref:type II secretion system F family protein n=1 Tax=Vibrio TaxID=662 RepID=UPI000DE8A1E2|nr:type II secretion system F family protein [Vibrionales bacterium C3R12]